MAEKDIRVVELFAGVGGFRLGLERSSPRFKTVWANQWEPGQKKQHAFECYVHHFGESPNHVNKDIALMTSEVPEHDLLVGGFPCQDYSVARTKAEGIVGKKGVLWWSMDKIISEKRPSFVLLENVDRLIKSPSSQRGRDFAVILRCLNDKGYAVEWRVINAAEYGEVQKRRRTFIFAFKEGTTFFSQMKEKESMEILEKDGFFCKGFPIKSLTAEKMKTFRIDDKRYKTLVDVSDKFSDMFYNGGLMRNGFVHTAECLPIGGIEPKTLRSVLQKDVDERYFIDEEDIEKWKYMKGSKREERIRKKDGGRYFYTEGKIPFPDSLDSPGRTMLTSEGRVNRSTHIVKDGDRFRLLTPIECERMNGFVDRWTNTGMSETARYFTMGNALVVPLIEKMGETINSIF